MTGVLAAAPIGAPVYRMQVELVCRDLDTAAHRAVERLQAVGGSTEHVAALLGLRLEQVAALRGQLDGTAGAHRRTLRVWVDPVHETVLSTVQGLELERPTFHGAANPLLEVHPPKVDELPRERFARAAGRTGSARARIAVDEVHELDLDLPGLDGPVRKPGRDQLLMLLSDTTLVAWADTHGPALEVLWGGVHDPALTQVARAMLLRDGGLDPQRLTLDAAREARERLCAALGATDEQAYPLLLDPATLEDRLLAAIGLAEEQVVFVADAPLKRWPRWLREALDDARRRGVQCVVRERANANGSAPLPRGCGLLAVRDRRWAVARSDALSFGRGWRLEELASQACLDVHEPAVIERLLDQLGIARPPARKHARRPAPRLEDVGAELLRAELERQRRHVPPWVELALGDGDVAAFCESVGRYHRRPDDREGLARYAVGTAWERVLHAYCVALEEHHARLTVVGFRLSPPEGGIDIDVAVTDSERRIWWALDAKHGRTHPDHPRKMRKQLNVALAQGWVSEGWEARGAIVHPDHLRAFDEATSDDDVVRWRIGQLEDGLLRPD